MTELNSTTSEIIEEENEEGSETAPKKPNETEMNVKEEKNRDFRCKLCESIFRTKSSKDLHMKRKHNDNRIQYTPSPADKRLQAKIDKGPLKFKCSSCEFECKSKPTLSNHRRKMHGSIGKSLAKTEPKKRQAQHFTCLECQSTFASKIQLKKHVKDQHVEEEDLEHSPPRKAVKEDLNNKIVEEEGNSEDGGTTQKATNNEKMEEDEEDLEAKIKVLNEENKRKEQTIAEMNEWIRVSIRRTDNLEKEMVEISKDNKHLKEEAIKTSDIIKELKEKEETLQNKINVLEAEQQQNPNPSDIQNIPLPVNPSVNPSVNPPVNPPVSPLVNPIVELPAAQKAIWRPPGHPPVEIDECVQNIRCDGNCEHVECVENTQRATNNPITCHDCKVQFKDKVTMMDHKRDSDHPSKRNCNKPDCERGILCWYKHRSHVLPQAVQNVANNTSLLTCKDCQQVFTSRNDLMFHKKHAHVSNIVYKYFLEGNCRRGTAGDLCWYCHDTLGAVTNVARPTIILPPPGSPSWDQDFPIHPTMGQKPLVGLKQQMTMILQQQAQQQKQQQQQHLLQMNNIMSQLMNMNV